jgi:hypothetical protein
MFSGAMLPTSQFLNRTDSLSALAIWQKLTRAGVDRMERSKPASNSPLARQQQEKF